MNDLYRINSIGWKVDPRKETTDKPPYGPRMLDLDVSVADELMILLHNLPNAYIRDAMLPALNENAYSHDSTWKSVSYDELIKFLGLMLSMEVYVLPERHMYWFEKSFGVFPGLNFGKHMAKSRFEDIMRYLQLSSNPDPDDQIIDFVEAVNNRLQESFMAGDTVCLDESMIKAYHRNLKGKVKIIRKPRPIGNELKNMADGRSKVVLKLEVMQGKEVNKNKEYNQEFGATTGAVLRLTKGLRGTGRIVVADSWFGSVKSAVELAKYGLYSIMLVKTAHKNFPMDKLNEAHLERGEWCTVNGITSEGIKLQAVNFMDLQLKHFISTCSTDFPGEPRKTKHCGLITRPAVAVDYLKSAAAIDIHNHVRTGSVGLEDAIKTKSPMVRQFTGVLGFLFTNAYLQYTYFKSPMKHIDFKMNLANAMINFSVPMKLSRSCLLAKELTSQHSVIKLAEKGVRSQKRCWYCKHGQRGVRKLTSYGCVKCGVPLCPPTAELSCWDDHINFGLPEKKDKRRQKK